MSFAHRDWFSKSAIMQEREARRVRARRGGGGGKGKGKGRAAGGGGGGSGSSSSSGIGVSPGSISSGCLGAAKTVALLPVKAGSAAANQVQNLGESARRTTDCCVGGLSVCLCTRSCSPFFWRLLCLSFPFLPRPPRVWCSSHRVCLGVEGLCLPVLRALHLWPRRKKKSFRYTLSKRASREISASRGVLITLPRPPAVIAI